MINKKHTEDITNDNRPDSYPSPWPELQRLGIYIVFYIPILSSKINVDFLPYLFEPADSKGRVDITEKPSSVCSE